MSISMSWLESFLSESLRSSVQIRAHSFFSLKYMRIILYRSHMIVIRIWSEWVLKVLKLGDAFQPTITGCIRASACEILILLVIDYIMCNAPRIVKRLFVRLVWLPWICAHRVFLVFGCDHHGVIQWLERTLVRRWLLTDNICWISWERLGWESGRFSF